MKLQTLTEILEMEPIKKTKILTYKIQTIKDNLNNNPTYNCYQKATIFKNNIEAELNKIPYKKLQNIIKSKLLGLDSILNNLTNKENLIANELLELKNSLFDFTSVNTYLHAKRRGGELIREIHQVQNIHIRNKLKKELNELETEIENSKQKYNIMIKVEFKAANPAPEKYFKVFKKSSIYNEEQHYQNRFSQQKQKKPKKQKKETNYSNTQSKQNFNRMKEEAETFKQKYEQRKEDNFNSKTNFSSNQEKEQSTYNQLFNKIHPYISRERKIPIRDPNASQEDINKFEEWNKINPNLYFEALLKWQRMNA